MKVSRLVSWFSVMLIVLCAISLCFAAEPINLIENATFIDGETQIPPPSWNLYGSLGGGNSISIVNSDNPALRALRIVDAVAASGEAGAVGIVQEVSAVAGQTYRLKSLAKAVSDNSADWVVMQLRFLPSKTAHNLYLEAGTTNFEEFTIEEVAPVDTNKIAVYIFCNSWQTADVLLREVVLQVVETNPPTINLTDPGMVVNNTYQVTATVSDDSGIAEVHIFIDDVLVKTATNAPYTYDWDTTAVNDGVHTITVRAIDIAGNETAESVDIMVNNSGAIFILSTPQDDDYVCGAVPISVIPIGDGVITKVEFKVDGVLLDEATAAPFSYTWDSTTVADGDHAISVDVTNDASVTTSDSITVHVDNTAPTVQITDPADAAIVTDTTVITATATDNNSVASVRFQIGNTLDVTDNSAPYSLNWDTTLVANGVYTITATATDLVGMQSTDKIDVIVANQTTDLIGHGPNPASASINFYFNGVSGTLRVYDISGSLVWTKEIPVNTRNISWNLINTKGTPLANGLYLYIVVDSQGKASAPQVLMVVR